MMSAPTIAATTMDTSTVVSAVSTTDTVAPVAPAVSTTDTVAPVAPVAPVTSTTDTVAPVAPVASATDTVAPVAPVASTTDTVAPVASAPAPVASATPIAPKATFFSRLATLSCTTSAVSCVQRTKVELNNIKDVLLSDLPAVGTDLAAAVQIVQFLLPACNLSPEQLQLANQILSMIGAGANDLMAAKSINSIQQLMTLVISNAQAALNAGLMTQNDMTVVNQYVTVINASADVLNANPTVAALLKTDLSSLTPIALAQALVNILGQINGILESSRLVQSEQVLSLTNGLGIANNILAILSKTPLTPENAVVVAPASSTPAPSLTM